jgi:DNA-binding transcriptional ArsR family regulator
MQRNTLAVVLELLVALTRRTVEQFFPNGEKVPDALAKLHALETLALRQIQGHRTTKAMLSQRTDIQRDTLRRYLSEMQQDGLIYSEGQGRGALYYVNLNRFNEPGNVAHLAAKVDDIIRAANQLTQIQNGRANWSVAL